MVLNNAVIQRRNNAMTSARTLLVVAWMTLSSVAGFMTSSPPKGRFELSTNHKVASLSKRASINSSSNGHANILPPLLANKSDESSKYTPPEASTPPKAKTNSAPYPKIGDIVRYYNLDGGDVRGETLIGKISLITAVLQNQKDEMTREQQQWNIEVVELEDVGEGYYAEYPSRERRSKRSTRGYNDLSPILASYVRSADAYKIPTNQNDGSIRVWWENYNLDGGYEGPAAIPIDESVVESDGERYDRLKGQLIRDAALSGLAGAVLAQLVKGTEDAIVYAAGAAAGVGYLYFLSLKTDTIGSPGAKFGNKIANIRFLLPLFVLLGVATTNTLLGSDTALSDTNLFSTVTPEQFGSAILGFVTYRIPLLLRQLFVGMEDEEVLSGNVLPGSAGVAMSLMQSNDKDDATPNKSMVNDNALTPVLLVCGPPGTGKTELVQKLLQDDDRLVAPAWTDRIVEGPRFEVMEARGNFIRMKQNGRFGLTKDAILNAARVDQVKGEDGQEEDNDVPQKAVVIDADVALAKSLTTNLSGARIIGVWVGLDSLDKFKIRLTEEINNNQILIPRDETEESVLRGKIREIIKDIEYGVVSGVFEFTILNDDEEDSLVQLKAAAEYCFK